MLRIFDSTLNFVGEVDDFESCIITRKYIGIETLEFKISMTSRNIAILNKHYIVWAGTYKVFEILHKEIVNEELDTIKVVAFGFGKTLDKRITIPPAGYSHDTASGSRDAIVKQYITNNIIAPTNTDRQIPYIQVAPVQDGEAITDQTRLKSLNDEVIRVLQSDDIGYYFDFDINTKKIIFDTFYGVDRSITNVGGIAPIIFSLDLDNIMEQTYIDSMTTAKTQIYVGGQGEGDARTIVEIGSSYGEERFESFSDARDTNDVNELTNRGLSDLNLGVKSFEAKINPNGNYQYEVDFDLGDLITLQSVPLNITLNTRITEVHEVYQKGQPMEIEVVFGEKYPSFLTDIKDQKKQISQLSTSESAVAEPNPGSGHETFTYDQIAPSNTWDILHNLNAYPSVTVIDSAGNKVEGNVQYISSNQLTVTFVSDFSGKAYLN